MMDFITIIAVVILLFVLFNFFAKPSGGDKPKLIPGPALQRNGSDLEDMAKAGGLHPYLMQLHEKYGPIAQFHMPKPVVSIASYELFKEQSRLFDRPASLYLLFEQFITPHSIQYANGNDGKQRHAAYARCFTLQSINSYINKIEEKTDEVLKSLEKKSSDDHVAASDLAFSFSIQTILKCGFGMSLDDEQVMELKKNYTFVWNALEDTLRGVVIKDGTELKKKMDEKLQEIHKLVNSIIEDTEARLKTSDPDENVVTDVIANMNLPSEVKMADLLSLFVGGFHTTGLLLTWAMHFIAKDPEIQAQIQDEIKDNIKMSDPITTDTLSKMTFIRQVIDETLRCAVLAPYAARVNNESDVILGEHTVPVGTPVIHALGVSLQDSERWPNPEKFDPERFSPENRKKIPSYGFEPFGFGKRKCLGYNFSMVEATMFLVKLLSQYSISTAPDQEDPGKVYGLVTHPKEEIWIQVKPR